MNIKIKLINKKTQFEISDILILKQLQKNIEDMIIKNYPDFGYVTRIYGEIIPMSEVK